MPLNVRTKMFLHSSATLNVIKGNKLLYQYIYSLNHGTYYVQTLIHALEIILITKV
jgi:hypothetical protein